jgi:uncharacterized membrane protein YhfC
MEASSNIGQVSVLSLAFMLTSIMLCAGALLGLCIWGKRKYRILFSFVSVFAGVAGFFTSLLLRGFLLQIGGWAAQLQAYPWLLAAAVALVTALTAEFTRFVIFTLMKERRDFPDGLAYGIGHGGSELILSAGLTLVMYYMCSSSINSGAWSGFIQSLPQESQAEYIQLGQICLNSAPVEFLVLGIDGLCKMLVQIALSVVVLTGFITKKKWQHLAAAILIHTIVAFIYLLSQVFAVNPWVVESLVLILAVVAVLYLVRAGRDQSRKDSELDALHEPQGQADIP